MKFLFTRETSKKTCMYTTTLSHYRQNGCHTEIQIMKSEKSVELRLSVFV